MSMSKAFTAVLVLRAIEEGRFRLDPHALMRCFRASASAARRRPRFSSFFVTPPVCLPPWFRRRFL